MRAELGMKIRRAKQLAKREQAARGEAYRVRSIMLATSISSDPIEQGFKQALRSTFLRGGHLPRTTAEYIRRLAAYRKAVKLGLAAADRPLGSTIPNGAAKARPARKSLAQATSTKQKKVRCADRCRKTDEAQVFVGDRHSIPDQEIVRLERRCLLRRIRTEVLLAKQDLRSPHPITRAFALERLVEITKQEVTRSKSRVGDFRFNISNRLQKAIVAVSPNFQL